MESSTAAELPTLEQACNALWLATLSLMTAFMQTAAPAHRYLLARRIARNFDTLRAQECYGEEARERFAKLAQRWTHKADLLSPQHQEPQGFFTRVQRLLAR
jgi:hypothetical protein